MKKLLIAVTAAMSAVAVHAATANWSTLAMNILDGTGKADGSATAAKYSGSAYLFDASKMAQSALYKLIAADISKFSATDTTGYVASGTVTSGLLPGTTKFEYGTQSESADNPNSYSFYFVLLKDENVYFSNVKSANASATTTSVSVGFGNQKDGSSLAPTTVGYAGEGAWSSVPEPTSGILLALGLCGLALRRKRS